MPRKSPIPISVGEKLVLQVRQFSDRVTSKLIGYEVGNYLIISMQSISPTDLRTYFKQGKSLVVRYVHDGAALGFKSDVIGAIIQPKHLVFISYPDKIQDMNLRKHKRGECYLPSECAIQGKIYPGFILDISKGGCGYSLKTKETIDVAAINIGNKVTLQFPVPGIEGKIEIQCIIRNSHHDTESLFLGFQFTEFKEDGEQKLLSYLEQMEVLEENG